MHTNTLIVYCIPTKVLLAYNLPTCLSSLGAYVYFAAQWRTDFEFGVVALLQHSMKMKLFHYFDNWYFSSALICLYLNLLGLLVAVKHEVFRLVARDLH